MADPTTSVGTTAGVNDPSIYSKVSESYRKLLVVRLVILVSKKLFL